MKTLILFRHARAESKPSGGTDHERRLTEEGRQAARSMGKFLRLVGDVPAVAITSSATRARETLEVASIAGDWQSGVRVADVLYNSNPSAVLDEIRGESDDATSLILVGHEPTWSEMIEDLAGGSVRFPSGAMARVDFGVTSWGDVRRRGGQLIWLVPPSLSLTAT